MSSLKTVVMRLPSRPACAASSTLSRCTALPPSSTTRALPILRSPSSLIIQSIRSKTTHAAAAQKSIDAGRHRTAQDLATKTHSSTVPLHKQVPSDPARSELPLDWDSFFKLRMRRRRIQVFFSATMGVVGFAAGAALLPTGIAEPLVAQIPLDPFISLGLITVAFAGVGWLVGPSIGSQVFYVMNRRFKGQIAQKEAEFFARIKKNRVDPTNSSAANPVPDYYGEKIQSVQGYRQWLKDQRAFNRKKSANLI